MTEAGITFFTLDVTAEQSIADLRASLQKLTGGCLDILVNCAGIAYTMTAIDTDVVAVQRMFDINLFGPMRMVRSFHGMIIRAKGTIINISSIGGIIPFMYGCKSTLLNIRSELNSATLTELETHKASYNASKAALAHWGNTLRVEMAPFE